MQRKRLIKRTAKSLFLVALFPVALLFWLLARVGNEDSVFQSFSQALSLIPGKLGIYARAAFYRLVCPGTSDEISIGFLTLFSHRDTTIEEGVYIGPQCNIGKCTIRKNVLIGSGVHILSGKNQHNFSDLKTPIKEQGGAFTKIIIGEDCWLGNLSVIMESVGEKTIIAAGSVVTKRFSDQSVLAGNPASTLRSRAEKEKTDRE